MQLDSEQLDASRAEFEREVKSQFFGIKYDKDEFGRYAEKVLDNMFWAWVRRQETSPKNEGSH